MNRFLFSQTYTFKEIGGHRKRHFLEMTENTGDKATFRFLFVYIMSVVLG